LKSYFSGPPAEGDNQRKAEPGSEPVGPRLLSLHEEPSRHYCQVARKEGCKEKISRTVYYSCDYCLRRYKKTIIFDLFLSMAKGKTCQQQVNQRDRFLEYFVDIRFWLIFPKIICIRKDFCLPKKCFIENALENKCLICQKFSQKCVKHRNKCAVQHGKLVVYAKIFNYFRED
jgi:hypothetical protein